MQAHHETLKKYGHQRRPSYGKTMPISSLLIDLSAPSAQRNYETLSKDGLSPKAATDQPVIFTFGQGVPRHASDIDRVTNDFLNQEKITGIAQRIESVEPQPTIFLKCTNYRPNGDDSADESSSMTDTTDTNSESENDEHETADSDNDTASPITKTNDTPALLRQLSHVLCDDSCHVKEQQQRPSLSRSISERKEFLASMLGDARAGVSVPSEQMEMTRMDSQEASAKPEPSDESSIVEVHSDDATNFDHADPIITEPDDSDATANADLVFREQHFAPIAIGSNDTEPSDTDPFEVEAIITYPEEKFHVVGVNEDLITFDDDKQPITPPESQLTIENLAKFDRQYFRDKLAVAEALAQATMMTPTAARRRLAARKMEMNINDPDFVYDKENNEYIPPKDLLLYLVR